MRHPQSDNPFADYTVKITLDGVDGEIGVGKHPATDKWAYFWGEYETAWSSTPRFETIEAAIEAAKGSIREHSRVYRRGVT